ncbi:hypothetical protein GCM10020001_080220 [Nonomuraea salmonea]
MTATEVISSGGCTPRARSTSASRLNPPRSSETRPAAALKPMASSVSSGTPSQAASTSRRVRPLLSPRVRPVSFAHRRSGVRAAIHTPSTPIVGVSIISAASACTLDGVPRPSLSQRGRAAAQDRPKARTR